MSRKQVELIIAALLPVCVLGVGFLVFSARAGLVPGEETANPNTSGPYYRTPGQYEASVGANVWFGPEVQSWILCEPPENYNSDFNPGGFFNITGTNETATVSNYTSGADKIETYKTQTWDFGEDGPWGTDQSVVYLHKVMWANETGGSQNGYPWNGVERHWRNFSTGKVESQTDVTGWMPGPDDDQDGRADWICPKFYKYGGWESGDPIVVVCREIPPDPPPVSDWERETDWDEPEQHNGTLARYGNTLDIWVDCIPAD